MLQVFITTKSIVHLCEVVPCGKGIEDKTLIYMNTDTGKQFTCTKYYNSKSLYGSKIFGFIDDITEEDCKNIVDYNLEKYRDYRKPEKEGYILDSAKKSFKSIVYALELESLQDRLVVLSKDKPIGFNEEEFKKVNNI